MRVLVTGARGQLGYDVVKELTRRGHEAVGVDKEEMDITDEKSVKDYLGTAQAEAVIHCAAYTAVDAAESNVDLVRKINVDGTRFIAEVCKAQDIPMMYISTDYVFDGNGETPWEPNAHRDPVNVYGQMKYEGELVMEELVSKRYIVRISWVFGENGKNFVRTMVGLGKKLGKVSVVADQFGSPTYTADLAVLLCDMIETDKYGTYHATNEGICSWYDFAKEIFVQAGLDVEVTPVGSDAFPTAAKRPLNSRMSKDKLDEMGFHRLPTWQDALSRYVKTLTDC
ncbi:dTDP-4-dehydrorhamnose reductase [Proteiniclasticum sediminis]|uniref:dTDP-4-dehydrorhamnose reductase n=1 Tax=Proteiniclasticum sediminis TaxID=2804028 RepID=UPI001E624ACF|nr:dTDP-4-dehydrorhamnose reductase [Proteiniclasticum sediminis]